MRQKVPGHFSLAAHPAAWIFLVVVSLPAFGADVWTHAELPDPAGWVKVVLAVIGLIFLLAAIVGPWVRRRADPHPSESKEGGH